MRTMVYFVRLIEPEFFNTKEEKRLLKFKKMENADFVARYLLDKHIKAIYISPNRAAYDTIQKFSKMVDIPIFTVDAFRKHYAGEDILDPAEHMKKQWADFSYKSNGGDSLELTQKRLVDALRVVIKDCRGKDVVIVINGTALSTIISYYQPNFYYGDYIRLMEKMPFIVNFRFDSYKCESIDVVDLVLVG